MAGFAHGVPVLLEFYRGRAIVVLPGVLAGIRVRRDVAAHRGALDRIVADCGLRLYAKLGWLPAIPL
ncbi:hypothetical protein Pla175_10960 [Pirellulimonas nuda]|uniref:Uncharacterized protein n=1 Tax=Pirellulimonas nuda TaxID=2528009 RepID=A0A518D8F9_9BACT|nr:hypothetical protein Pla175_10960 [Pirellulimonas nuda]